MEHHNIWQLSTSIAVVEGVFGEALKVSDLPEHGDFGIGTFEHLDGEGILLDGICWQARADGSLIQAPLDEGIPFWIASRFQSEKQFTLENVQSLEQLGALLDPFRPSANLFVPSASVERSIRCWCDRCLQWRKAPRCWMQRRPKPPSATRRFKERWLDFGVRPMPAA